MKYVIRFIAGILAAGCLVVAQTKPTFEVASIKPGNPNEVRSGVHIQPGGLFKCENTTVKTLIRFAYDLQNYEIAGGPPWMPSAIFTIEARASSSSPEGFDDQTMKLRIQALLEDRFAFHFHGTARTARFAIGIGKGIDAYSGNRLCGETCRKLSTMSAKPLLLPERFTSLRRLRGDYHRMGASSGTYFS